LSYLLSHRRTWVNSRCWYAARAGSKLIRSPKKARECSSKQCVGNGVSSIHVLAVLFGGTTDSISDFITQGNWYSPTLFPRVAHTHKCQVSFHITTLFLSHSHGALSCPPLRIRASLAEFVCSPMHLHSCASGCYPQQVGRRWPHPGPSQMHGQGPRLLKSYFVRDITL
jgi:hypothetical protein